eukprot:TRINITY_DN4270_c1_g2_i1.p1 TRINITY_DN4270_c1_g2~~TRINITY_DN4270_c1_g2_i1.p1  ORF type:complete len:225 (+),score=46.86 TRINITY_DN4270_c1_g2_i1:44-676(+)
MSGETVQRLVDEIDRRNELISMMERKEELLKNRMEGYRQIAYSSPPRRPDVNLEEELHKVEGELRNAMEDYNTARGQESEATTFHIIESLLGNGGLREALGGKQVSHKKASLIADKVIQHYKEQSTDPSTIEPIMNLLAREGLAAHITRNQNTDTICAPSSDTDPYKEDMFTWFSETKNLNQTPGSIANRLRRVHLKCDELLRVLEPNQH